VGQLARAEALTLSAGGAHAVCVWLCGAAGGEKILEVFELKLKEAINKLPFAKVLTLKHVQVGPCWRRWQRCRAALTALAQC
jgi:hypothetical protein